MAHPAANDCFQPMGWTSENVARDFSISRTAMDEAAATSHQRAEAAQRSGHFGNEIMAIEAYSRNSDGSRAKIRVTQDDGIRIGTTAESLGKVRAAFPQWPPANTTGGNASQLTDGGAFVLLMTRRKAEELNVPSVRRSRSSSAPLLTDLSLKPVFLPSI